MKESKEKEYKRWKRILDTFDLRDEVETPYGLGTVYIDNGEYLEVAIRLVGHSRDLEPFSYGPVIMAIPRNEVRRIKE